MSYCGGAIPDDHRWISSVTYNAVRDTINEISSFCVGPTARDPINGNFIGDSYLLVSGVIDLVNQTADVSPLKGRAPVAIW